MKIEVDEAFDKLTEADILQFEIKWGIILPPDYKQFLLKNNGGKPNPNKFKVDIRGFENCSRVRCFFGIHKNDKHDLSEHIQRYKHMLPTNLLPIASEIASDLICLSVNGNDYGKIYFWDSNWIVTDRVPDYSNVHFLANSLLEFFDKLFEDGED